ncbi:MAG: LysR substrate-binding domain-containing protein [Pseudomonadota bacterium]
MDEFGPTRPTLRQLQYFVAVAEHGAFGVAADLLAVAQPSLSRQLAAMEAELAITLFERTSRRVKLTPAGEDLLPRARYILQQIREFQAAARGATGMFGNRLSLGVLPSIGAYFMPAVNHLLHELYQELQLYVEEGSTTQLLTMLKDGRLDAVVATPNNERAFSSADLFKETLWVCAASDDPISHRGGPVSLRELSDSPLLSLRSGFRLATIVERLAELAGTYVRRDYQGVSLDAVRQMAIMGTGVAVLPSLYALSEAVRDPKFVVRRIDHPEAVHPIALLWRSKSPHEADCLQLAEHLMTAERRFQEDQPDHFR